MKSARLAIGTGGEPSGPHAIQAVQDATTTASRHPEGARSYGRGTQGPYHAKAARCAAVAALTLFLALAFLSSAALAQTAQPADDPGTEVEIEFFVIGFDVNEATEDQLRQVAEVSGGSYVDARSGAELEAAIGQGLGVASDLLLQAEAEPNDSFGQANRIGSNHSLTAKTLPAGDRDWFVLNVTQHGELQIQVSNVPPDLAANLRVWTANKETLTGWFAPLAAGGAMEVVVDLPAPGDYYLEVADTDSNQSSDQEFTVTTIFAPSPDQAEPNGSFGSAAPLSLGTDVPATLLPAGDQDWYRFDVDQHGELVLATRDVPAEMAVNLRVWTANKETLTGWFAPLAAGGATEVVVDLPTPGAYYLEVAAGDSEQRSIEPFVLRADFTASADRGEANANFGSATPLTIGDTLDATILPAGDRDWYRFEVSHHGELSIGIVDVAEEVAVDARIWNANKDTLTNWYKPLAAGGNTEAVVDLPSAGSYYLELAADAGSQRSIDPFQIVTSFIDAPDKYEPNNTFGTAAALESDDDLLANVLPAGDRDWFVVDAPHHGELRIVVSQVPADLAVNIRVWTANKDTLTGWFSPLAAGGDTQAIVDLPQPGRYFIEIAGGDSNQRHIEPYRLSLAYTPAADQGEPNDTADVATPVNLDETIPANILPAGDRDWCVFEIPEPSTLYILVVNSSPDLTINFRLWNDANQALTGWFAPLAKGGNVEASADIAEPGTYYLEVADSSSQARSIEPYLLRFSTEPIEESELEELPDDRSATNFLSGSFTISQTVQTIVETIKTATFSVARPEGWVVEERGPGDIVMAPTADEALAAGAVGPRFRMRLLDNPPANIADLAAASSPSRVLVDAAPIFLPGLEGETITVEIEQNGTPITQQYVVASSPDGEAYEVILEAPSALWDEHASTLETMLNSVTVP